LTPPGADETARVEARIRAAFDHTEYPGDAWLVGSSEGCEPESEVGPFRGRDWRELDAPFLDAHYSALSFFSEGGLRYFLPAFLLADLGDALQTADPVFHLAGAFHDLTIDHPGPGGRPVRRLIGRSQLVNPRRYGAMTFLDYARCRLSVFTREECVGIVEYLRWRRSRADLESERSGIDAALADFWLPRAEHAPTQAALAAHLADDAAVMAAIAERHGS
jgi:hypothetical protein